ncbi:MBL fold metallo-hydrolase [Marimonas lutisalis]|uniref:MBL fold metallo-hydrolase n=1 Tax=Marimonas lutisalis TaxID=2545756 RepID=UPI0010F9D1D1|nr:MBL fold metallo-hydrolase [Marimonas lutisalis]
MRLVLLALSLLIAFALPARAAPPYDVQEVAPRTFAIVGPFGNRTPENLGNNATFGLVVTDDGAVLIDPGGSEQGAAALDTVVQSLTDQPVRFVINTGGQDHRWIGNAYWQARGATVIASSAAIADQAARASMQQTMLSTLLGDAFAGTVPAHADIGFDDSYTLSLGGRTLEIRHPAIAHTPGDSFVWVPDASTVFTGDIVYVGRLLGLFDFSSSSQWLEAFDAMAALDPVHVIPGHGPATDLATAKRETRDYIAHLRTAMRAYIDEGGDIIGSVEIDQSAFSYLIDFDILAGRNAQQVFTEMEWE